MNTVLQNAIVSRSSKRTRATGERTNAYAAHARVRALTNARRLRERILSCLAFVMLIVAWNATLRLDEQISPPRMRMSHAVEMEGESQNVTWMP